MTRNNNFVQQGLPLGMRYHGADYGENAWDTYWYEKNLRNGCVRSWIVIYYRLVILTKRKGDKPDVNRNPKKAKIHTDY